MNKNPTHMVIKLNLNSLIHSKFKCLENKLRKQRPKYQLMLSSINLHTQLQIQLGETKISTEFKHQVKMKNRMNNAWACFGINYIQRNLPSVNEFHCQSNWNEKQDILTIWLDEFLFRSFSIALLLRAYNDIWLIFSSFRFVSELSASAPE